MNKKFLSLALSTMMLLTACGGGNSNQPAENASTDQGAETASTEVAETKESIGNGGGSDSLNLIFTKQKEGTNFDTPWWNRGDIYKVITYRGLFKADPTLSEFTPELITDYTVSDDGLSYEFTLKDGLKWSDGEDLTVDDVKFSIEGALKGAYVNTIYTNAFSRIKGGQDYRDGNADSIEGLTVEGNKIKFAMDKPVGNMINVLAQFAILPQHGFEGEDMMEYSNSDFWKAPITNGMYKVDEVVTDSYIKLSPNEYYEGQAPKIPSVVVNIVPSDAILNSVLGDQADVFNSKVPAEIAAVNAKDNWEGQTVDTLFYYSLIFNETGATDGKANEFMDDYKFREAVYYAIDRDNIAKNIFPDISTKLTYGVPDSDSKNKNTDLEMYDYNPEKAKEILKEIGFKQDKPLQFKYYMADQSSVDLYNVIAQNLKDVGIDVNVQKFAGDAGEELFQIRNYDIALKGLSAFGYEEYYGEYASINENFKQLIGDVGKKYDDLYNEFLAESDPDKRSELLKQLQEVESEDLSKMNIFLLKNIVFVNTDKVDTKGAQFSNPWYAADIGFENWELK